MRYAILSDIHGNLEGLNTVLEHANSKSVDCFVCGGDVVSVSAHGVCTRGNFEDGKARKV